MITRFKNSIFVEKLTCEQSVASVFIKHQLIFLVRNSTINQLCNNIFN